MRSKWSVQVDLHVSARCILILPNLCKCGPLLPPSACSEHTRAFFVSFHIFVFWVLWRPLRECAIYFTFPGTSERFYSGVFFRSSRTHVRAENVKGEVETCGGGLDSGHSRVQIQFFERSPRSCTQQHRRVMRRQYQYVRCCFSSMRLQVVS